MPVKTGIQNTIYMDLDHTIRFLAAGSVSGMTE
jgi:hypothetical protein